MEGLINNTMTLAEFAEQEVESGSWSEFFSEMYWSDSFSSEKCLEVLLRDAADQGVNIIPSSIDEFEYDDFFYNCYKSDPDKGLS